MTHIIPTNLPIYFQCLCVPTEWGRTVPDISAMRSLAKLLIPESPAAKWEDDLLQVWVKRGHATNFDPWAKRNEFFRLKPGDTTALLEFLPTVGLFEAARIAIGEEGMAEKWTIARTKDEQPYQTRYLAKTSEKEIWGAQRLLIGSLRNLEGHTGKYTDFQMRFLDSKNGPRAVLTTTTFVQSVLLTLAVDKVQGAKVRKCARPDCGILFSITSGHKRKYCEWYCGHIESVRKQRHKTRQVNKKARRD